MVRFKDDLSLLLDLDLLGFVFAIAEILVSSKVVDLSAFKTVGF